MALEYRLRETELLSEIKVRAAIRRGAEGRVGYANNARHRSTQELKAQLANKELAMLHQEIWFLDESMCHTSMPCKMREPQAHDG